MLFLDGISVGGGGKAHKRQRAHHYNVCDNAFKSLLTPNQHIIWQDSGHVLVCKGCGKKFKTHNNINKHKKIFGFKPHHRKSFCNFSIWGKGGGEMKRTVLSGSRKRSDIFHHLKWKYIIVFIQKLYYVCFNFVSFSC